MSLLSFLDVSLETANKFYTWGWKASLLGAAITFGGVTFLMWGTRVRDKDFEANMAQLNIGAAQANLEAEKLHKQNLELEAALAPRVIDQEKSAEQLRAFHGMSVIIESVDDSESWRLAGQIAMMLDATNIRGAQWHVQSGMKRIPGALFDDGVTVWANVGVPLKGDKSIAAADALVAVLKENHIEAARWPAADLLLNTILIRVGLKPQKVGAQSDAILWK